MLDNIVMSRLYRPGSVARSQAKGQCRPSGSAFSALFPLCGPEVAYVSKSGGMSNELASCLLLRRAAKLCRY